MLGWIDFSTSILFSNRNSQFYQMDWNMCKVNGDWDYYCVLIFWEEVTSSVHKSLLCFFLSIKDRNMEQSSKYEYLIDLVDFVHENEYTQ